MALQDKLYTLGEDKVAIAKQEMLQREEQRRNRLGDTIEYLTPEKRFEKYLATKGRKE